MSKCYRCKFNCTDIGLQDCQKFKSKIGGVRPNSGRPKSESMDRFQVTILKSVSEKIGRARLRVLMIEAAEFEMKKI